MNPVPVNNERDAARRAELMSLLADGEVDGSDLERGCLQWREDARSREAWHVYHLIGDVLRSEELAKSPTRDAAFVHVLRQRMQAEPALLAPVPVLRRATRTRRRMFVAAAFGGVAVVAGVVASSGSFRPQGWDAQSGLASGPMRPVAASAAPATMQRLDLDGKIIRDARLDAYFEAHRGAVGAIPSALPGGGALRSVDVIAPQR
jgi:sigma-E factor negative regulatory protein RseA